MLINPFISSFWHIYDNTEIRASGLASLLLDCLFFVDLEDLCLLELVFMPPTLLYGKLGKEVLHGWELEYLLVNFIPTYQITRNSVWSKLKVLFFSMLCKF
jgi:hypothetical protein